MALLSLTQDTGHMAEAGLEGSHWTLQDSNVLDLRGTSGLHPPWHESGAHHWFFTHLSPSLLHPMFLPTVVTSQDLIGNLGGGHKLKTGTVLVTPAGRAWHSRR